MSVLTEVGTESAVLKPFPAPREWDPYPERRTVLVAGATGRQGGAVVRHLLKAGWIPRGLTRDPSSPAAQDLAFRGVELVQGDMMDLSSLMAAMDGAHGVFSVQESRRIGFHQEIRQGMNLADAAARSGVGHFVYASMASADRWPNIDRMEAKYTVENHLRWIGLARTILRPALFLEDHIGPDPMRWVRVRRFVNPLPADRRIQVSSVDDLARFAVAAFLDPGRFLGRRVAFAGDEVTNAGIAGALSLASGRKVHFRRSPGILTSFGARKGLAQVYRKLATSGFGLNIEAIKRENQAVGMSSLTDWLRARINPVPGPNSVRKPSDP